MREREPNKETIGRGELFYLYHPGTAGVYSGYGLTGDSGQKDTLVGLLMIGHPYSITPEWLQAVEAAYGPPQLMTPVRDRGIACQMHIDASSLSYLHQFTTADSRRRRAALRPLLEQLPTPVFNLRWDEETQIWRSEFVLPNELSGTI